MSSNNNELLEILQKFLQIDLKLTFNDFLCQHPELLSDQMFALFQILINEVETDDSPEEIVSFLKERFLFLQKCRSIDIEALSNERQIIKKVPYLQELLSLLSQLNKGESTVLTEFGIGTKVLLNKSTLQALEDEEKIFIIIKIWNTYYDICVVEKEKQYIDELVDFSSLIIIFFSQSTIEIRDVLKYIAGNLFNLYFSLRSENLLIQAISCLHYVLNVTPEKSPDRVDCIVNLGLACSYSDNPDIQNEAIVYFHQAIDAISKDSPDMVTNIIHLMGTALRDLYSRSNNFEFLNEAVTCFRQAIDSKLLNSLDKSKYLDELAMTLNDLYTNSGDPKLLNEAVTFSRQALNLTPLDSPLRINHLNNLGLILRNQYVRSGDLNLLNESIRYFYQVLDIAQSEIASINNLGVSLTDLWIRTDNIAYLLEAINHFRQGLNIAPQESPYRLITLINLGVALRKLYTHSENPDDLNEAITYFQKAFEIIPQDSPSYDMLLNNLGRASHDLYACSGDPALLKKTINYYQQAIDSKPPDSPIQANRLNNLGKALFDLYRQKEDPDFIPKIRDCFLKVCQLGLIYDKEAVIDASQFWGNWELSLSNWDKAIQAYRYGLQAIDDLMMMNLNSDQKRSWLKEVQGLPANMAYALTRSGQTKKAILLLEHGNARILSETINLHAGIKSTPLIKILANPNRYFKKLQTSVIQHPAIYFVTTAVGSLILILLENKLIPCFIKFQEKDLDNILTERDNKGNPTGGFLYGQFSDNGCEQFKRSLDVQFRVLGEILIRLIVETLDKECPGCQQITLLPSGRLNLFYPCILSFLMRRNACLIVLLFLLLLLCNPFTTTISYSLRIST